MMRDFAILALAVSLLGLTACTEPPATTYPVSGESCSPADPVQDIRAECGPPM